MSKSKNTIKNKMRLSRNGLIGLFLTCLIVGGAAAVIMSNTATSSFGVYSGMPFNLAWITDPSDDYMLAGNLATGELGYENTHNSDFIAVKIAIAVQTPNITLTRDNFEVSFNGITFDPSWFSHSGGGLWEGDMQLSNILALETGSWAFTFKVIGNGEVAGAWSVNLLLGGVAA